MQTTKKKQHTLNLLKTGGLGGNCTKVVCRLGTSKGLMKTNGRSKLYRLLPTPWLKGASSHLGCASPAKEPNIVCLAKVSSPTALEKASWWGQSGPGRPCLC